MLLKRLLKNYHLVCVFLVFSMAVPSQGQVLRDIMGHKGSYFNKETFKRAMGQATTKVNHTSVIKLQYGQLKGIAGVEEIDTEASQGSWRVILTGWRETGGDDILIKKAPSVIMNYGNKMQYVFFSQEIPSYVYDRVDQKMEKLKNNTIKEYKDVTVEFGQNENQMMFVAEYPYANNTSSDRIKDRLVFYMNQGRELIRESMEETRKAEKDYRNDMEDKKFSTLSLDEFMFLVGGLDDVDLKELEGGLGRWEFLVKDTPFEYQHFGDKFVFSTYKEFPKGLSQEVKDALIQKFKEQVADKPAKGASSMEALWYPGYEQYMWVKANYVLDGEIKGKDVDEWSDKFVNDYGKDIYKDLEDALKDYREDLEDQALTYLSSAAFMQLVNDDLNDFQKPHEEAKEGMWEFHIDDNWFEIHNYGDRVLLSLYRKLPESVSKDNYPDILSQVKEKIDDKQAKKATSMEVEWYPGYPDVIWVKAFYPFDGKLKGDDLKDAYKDFIYDYGKDRHKDIAKIIETYD